MTKRKNSRIFFSKNRKLSSEIQTSNSLLLSSLLNFDFHINREQTSTLESFGKFEHNGQRPIINADTNV